MTNLKPEIRGYIAGLIDGEGCIGLFLHKNKYGKGYGFDARITITSCYLPVLEYVISQTNIGKIYSKGKQRNNWKESYRWEISANGIRLILPQIIDLLIVKKEQACLMLKYLELRDAYSKFDVNNNLQAMEIRNKIKALNKRGI